MSTKRLRASLAGVLAAVFLAQATVSEAIVRPDREVVTGEADYTALLEIVDAEGERYVNCTGVLVSPTIVISAAHCFLDDEQNSTMLVRTGGVTGYAPAVTRRITAIVVHRKYMRVLDAYEEPEYRRTPGGVRKGENEYDADIALVQLDAPITSVKPATLAGKGYRPSPGWRTYGYGATGDGEGESPMRLLTAPQRDAHQRLADLDRPWARVVLASAPSGTLTGTCWGDSGGPLVDGAGIVIGITSFGFDDVCATREPTVFTRVSEFDAWIRKATRTAWLVARPELHKKSARPVWVTVE